MEETMHAFGVLAAVAVVCSLYSPASPARTRVYRCVQVDGVVSYQQIPCGDGSRPVEIRTRHSGWTALRPGEKSLLKQYRSKPAGSPHSRQPARREPPGRESKSCWKRRKQLEAVRSRLRRGYTLDESYELRRKRDNYQDYLRQFCS